MITITAWKSRDNSRHELDPDTFDPENTGDWKLVWIDLQGEDAARDREFLQGLLGLPKLAVDDALRQRHPPKYEGLDDGWSFQLMRGFNADSVNVKSGTIQLALFWRDNLVVTRHEKPSASVADVRNAIDSGEMPVPDGASWLLYAIQRKIFDRYLPILLHIEARLEAIEDMLLEQPDDSLLGELMEFSSQLKRLRRISAYHEKCIATMRMHSNVKRGVEAAQLTDLFEHAERLHSLATLHYEIISDLINGYLSISSHRLNNVMRVLTVITALFVPLTFIAGVYGMNFQHMPELATKWGYYVVLSVMGVVAIVLLALFRRKGWI